MDTITYFWCDSTFRSRLAPFRKKAPVNAGNHVTVLSSYPRYTLNVTNPALAEHVTDWYVEARPYTSYQQQKVSYAVFHKHVRADLKEYNGNPMTALVRILSGEGYPRTTTYNVNIDCRLPDQVDNSRSLIDLADKDSLIYGEALKLLPTIMAELFAQFPTPKPKTA
jgi:hypothetical protein